MKYGLMPKVFLKLSTSLVKKSLNKEEKKNLKNEYKAIILRASDIGSNNNLISSYFLAAFFIALNRSNKLDVEENYANLEKGMRKSKLLKLFMGDSKGYFSQKHMEFRKKWSQETHLKRYKNDWVVDFISKDQKYEFGLDYLECGVCKLCRDEGCFELAKYLCRLDYLLVEIMGLGLDRTMTLANGDPKCDFRFYRK